MLLSGKREKFIKNTMLKCYIPTIKVSKLQK